MTKSACHYDWNASINADEAVERRSVLDRATDIYRLAEARAVKAVPMLSRFAIPVTAVMVLAGLGVGTTLLYDPPAIRLQASALAGIEARAAPEDAAQIDRQPKPIQGIPAPKLAAAPSAPAIAPANPVAEPVRTAGIEAADSAEADIAAAHPIQDTAASPLPDSEDVEDFEPDLAYLPDEATTTSSIPAAVLEAAVKDTRQDKSAVTALAASSDDVAESSARKSQVKTAVNMRASPDQDAKVLKVVPAKASVSVIDCNSWCKIAFEGQEGFVYKSFVR